MRGDDGIGIYVVQFLKEKFSGKCDIITIEEMGLCLLDYLSGYKKAVIVDSIYTGKKEVGEIHIFKKEDLISKKFKSSHYIGIPEIIELAEKTGIPFPEKLLIIGIEVKDPYLISTDLTQELKEKFNTIAERVEREIEEFMG